VTKRNSPDRKKKRNQANMYSESQPDIDNQAGKEVHQAIESISTF
jgi:hypothetical protein